MKSIEQTHKDNKITNFSLISAYSWDFFYKTSRKIGKFNENFENAVAVVRIAHKIKVDLAPTIPSIINDPFYVYLDEFMSEWFNNLPETSFSDEELTEFVAKTDLFIETYKDLLAEV